MYTFRPVTGRMQAMHEAVRSRVFRYDAERALIATAFYKEHEHMVPAIRRPLLLRTICEQMTVRVEDYEMIVGNNSRYYGGCGSEPDWHGAGWIPADIDGGEWTLEADGLYHNPPTDELRLTVSPEDVEAFRSIASFWKGRTYNDIAMQWQPEIYQELCRVGVCTMTPGYPLMMMPGGHVTAGFKKIIDVGYGAIRKQARDWLDAHENDLMGENAEKVMFYTAVTIACDAAIILARRYGEACREKAGTEADPDRKAELLSMGDSLDWIAENPCRTFREALQQALLYQYLLRFSGIGDSGSFGRVDQYTWPYLKKELEAGTITMDQAQEILDCFYMKINGMYGGGRGPIIKITGIGNTYLHNTIGGVDKDGNDATNPVTYMVLESVCRLYLHDPTISLRVHKNTPDSLWELAIETSRRVGGLPLFQNDEVIIPGAVRELGFSLEDARDYAIVGCQEITGSGNDYPPCNGTCPPHGALHYSVLLDMAINGGVNPLNGQASSLGGKKLYEMTSIEEAKEAWKRLAAYYIKAEVSVNNYLEYLIQYNTPHAILSLSLDGCMESGRDCTAGGAKYNSFGGTATGLATVADSLSAIAYMCFDARRCTTRELYDAVMANWEGYESLRQQIINEAPHFGNADPRADEMMRWVVDTYYETTRQCWSKRAKHFKAGLYGAADHVGQGYTTWATPDGRFAGTPIADAASPVQGRDTNGPTAVLQSSLCYDHSKYMDGVCLNIRIHPTALSRQDGIEKLRDMVKAYMENGGAEIQFNVVSTQTMHEAQAEPEKYRDLVVRIAGYSAYFVELSLDCQNDLIARNENMI